MGLFISQPWLTFLPALGLFSLFGITQAKVVGVAACLWAIYGVYELGMKYRILCGGECNIRIDLLVLYPLLLVASVLAISYGLLALWQRYRR